MTSFKYFTVPFTETSLKKQFWDNVNTLRAAGKETELEAMVQECRRAVKLAERGATRKRAAGRKAVRTKKIARPVQVDPLLSDLMEFAKGEIHNAFRRWFY